MTKSRDVGGSADSLNVSVRWGCSAKARQMRCTALRLSPLAVAIDRVLQWVASAGVVSRVRVITASTCASLIVRGAPGRGSSRSPSRRRLRNRARHLPTVCLVSRSSRATIVLVLPAAHSRISRARCATACAVFGRRAHCSRTSRSARVNVRGGIGRPVRTGVLLSLQRRRDAHKLFHVHPRQDTGQYVKHYLASGPCRVDRPLPERLMWSDKRFSSRRSPLHPGLRPSERRGRPFVP